MCEVRQSAIHGTGVIATKSYEAREVVFMEAPLFVVGPDDVHHEALCTPAWKLTYEVAVHGGDQEYVSGRWQPIGFSSLQWDRMDEVALAYVTQNCHLTRNQAFRLYGVVCAINTPPQPGHAAIYQLGSHLNHACRPNARVVFERNTLSVVAVKPIAEGEEVTFSYIGDAVYDAHDQRLEQSETPLQDLGGAAVMQAALRAAYGFECLCEAHAG